ncbi:MAG: 3-hydroxyacyl-CoA dehydrogenase family protein, partial [Thiolinea sp.]
MTTEINKVAVIGAGVMGAGIAAHVANAGIPVVLLDIVPKDAPADKRSAIAEGAVAKMLKADPAPFMHKRNAKLITTGNLEDNLDLISDCDWVIEAIIENLAIKQDLYRKLESVRKPGSMLSSNTSTIPMNDLMGGMADGFAKNFMITHFFNPPRYMRLLEIAYGDQTDMDAVAVVRDFSDKKL